MDTNLLLCMAGCVLVTVLPKVLPITFLNGDNLHPLFRKWLDFVPVAVMAALVGSDIFFYDGSFNLGSSNLYLMASIPCFLIAYSTKNYFIPIIVGLGFVIGARALGMG